MIGWHVVTLASMVVFTIIAMSEGFVAALAVTAFCFPIIWFGVMLPRAMWLDAFPDE